MATAIASLVLTAALVLGSPGPAAGLGALFSHFPNLRRVLETVAALYIVYLAYRVATASPPTDPSNAGGAPRFRDGMLLNVINPKSYAAFLAIFSQSILPVESTLWAYGLTAVTCLAVAASTNIFWIASGQLLTSWLRAPARGTLDTRRTRRGHGNCRALGDVRLIRAMN